MTLALLFHYLMLKMFRMLIHPSSGACDLFVELFHELYCFGSMCVGVTLWFGWSGVVSGCRLKPISGYHFNNVSKGGSFITQKRDLITIPKLAFQYFDVSYYHQFIVWDVVQRFELEYRCEQC